MKDEQIIKALECCADDSVIRCEECPYGVSIFSCRQMQLRKDALDLINRLQDEKEGLINGQISLQKALRQKEAELENITEKFNCQQTVYADLSNIIKEKNAEIEKLKTDNSSMQSTLAKMSMGVEEAKADAIKEFAERLKARAKETVVYKNELCAMGTPFVIVKDIDNLVKEKVGDTE